MNKFFIFLIICILSVSNNADAWWYNKIKIKDCYDPKKPKFISNDIWEFEIDLKKNTAVQTYEALGKINIRKLRIKAMTDRYIALADPKGGPDMIFDLKKDTYSSEYSKSLAKILGQKKIVLKCNFTKTPF